LKNIQGGVTAPKGFLAAAVEARIKYPRKDLALIFSQEKAAVAGLFTSNRIQAATVRLCRQRVKSGRAQAIIVNSGCANACTGARGTANAKRMAAITAMELGIPEKSVLVCSTGTIGLQLPMDRVEAGIPAVVSELSRSGGDAAAKAIMTTDTVDKQEAVEITIDGVPVRIGGMCKGAGMISPNMATMLGFLTTDAAVTPAALRACLRPAVNMSFNCVTVDGDQSTNDTVLFLANGMARNRVLSEKHGQWNRFVDAVNEVTKRLAMKMARDGEGATKFVSVKVTGAASDSDARKAARAVANSMLVKTSWFGADPNWGRVIAAVGYSGAKVVESKVDISYDGLKAVTGGQKDSRTQLAELEKVLKQKGFSVEVNLYLGHGSNTVYTCDCSLDYVKINAEYMT